MRLIVMMVLGWSVAQSAAASWRLPVPVGQDDVSGALVVFGGGVYQAKDFGLQETADGGIAISWLQGYDEDGRSVRIERAIEGASPLGFARAAVGVDSAGFLLVGAPGTSRALSTPVLPCGPTRIWSCSARDCRNCGDAPTCACQDVSGGGCDPFTHDFCEGTCAAGTCGPIGNNACGCVLPDGAAPVSTKTPTGKKRAPRLQPVNPPE
jgi:hypothetical protein